MEEKYLNEKENMLQKKIKITKVLHKNRLNKLGKLFYNVQKLNDYESGFGCFTKYFRHSQK